MKFEKRHIVIALLIIYVFTLTFSTIGFVHAVEKNIHVLQTDEHTLSAGTYYLYLDEDTPLTLGFLKEHPEYVVTFIADTGNTTVYWEMPNGSVGSACNTSTSATPPYVLTYNNNSYLINCYNKYGDASLSYPIKLGNSNESATITINSNFIYNSDGTLTDPDEIPEETEPVVPPEDDGEDTAGLLDGLLDGIKSFFTELFKPITDLIESWQKAQESEATIWDALELLYDYIKGYTFEPIFEFFESIVNNDALTIVVQVWNFPLVKELLIAAVAILVISGFIRLLTTL